jgi:hypothetical protein
MQVETRMPRLALIAALALTLAAALVPATSAAPRVAVSLSIVRHDGFGHTTRAALSCRGARARGTGFLSGRAAGSACADARRHARFLAAHPVSGRHCGEHEGNNATARVRGHVGARRVNRGFSARSDCGVLDWLRVGKLLGGVPTGEQ